MDKEGYWEKENNGLIVFFNNEVPELNSNAYIEFAIQSQILNYLEK